MVSLIVINSETKQLTLSMIWVLTYVLVYVVGWTIVLRMVRVMKSVSVKETV